MTTNPNFQADIRDHLFGEYLLDSGEIVFGNSTSHVRSWMRGMNASGRRWRNLGSDSGFEDLCEAQGFKVRRGRGRRMYKGGKTSWGVPCDVITELTPVPRFDIFDATGALITAGALLSDAASAIGLHTTELLDIVAHTGAAHPLLSNYNVPPVAREVRPAA